MRRQHSDRCLFLLVHEASGLMVPCNAKSTTSRVVLTVGSAQALLEAVLLFYEVYADA